MDITTSIKQNLKTTYSNLIPRSEHKYPFIIGNIRVPMLFTFSENPTSMRLDMDKEFNQTQTLGGYTFEHWGKKPTMLTGSVLIRKFGDVPGFVSMYRDNKDYDLQDPLLVPEYITLRTLFDIDQKRLYQITNNTTESTKPAETTNNTATTTEEALKPKSFKELTSEVAQEVKTIIKTVSNKVESGYNWLNKKFTSDTFIYYKDTIYFGFFTKLTTDDVGDTPFVLKVSFNFLVTNTTNDWLVDSIFATGESSKVMSRVWGGISTGSVAAKLFASFLK